MRTIQRVHSAVRDDIDDLVTYRALPTSSVGADRLDPFLFLNHHGLQVYPPRNEGLPFGPHPHRGFETVSFILKGDLAHRDTGGHSSVIGPGGVQWMTAGSGLIHEEVSSEEFMARGGELEILQLWVNLPARLKMTAPRYIGLQGDQIPKLKLDQDLVTVHLVSGEWDGTRGPFHPLTDVQLSTVEFRSGGSVRREIPVERTVFFYVVSGTLRVNGRQVKARQLVEFGSDHPLIEVVAESDAWLLWGHAEPCREPIVSYGPFVMNTEQEIRQAISDYNSGKFGL